LKKFAILALKDLVASLSTKQTVNQMGEIPFRILYLRMKKSMGLALCFKYIKKIAKHL